MDADDGQVGLGVVADEVGGELAAVGERDLDAVGVVDDVAVGEDVAARREDEPRAAAAPLAPPRPVCDAAMWTTDGLTRSARR